MGQGDLPAPRGGGLFRRRREKRQLEHLVQASRDHEALVPSSAHVRVVEDLGEAGAKSQTNVAEGEGEASEQESPIDAARESPLPGGFHVRPVPLDEPISE
jgi:hypothetical protein